MFTLYVYDWLKFSTGISAQFGLGSLKINNTKAILLNIHMQYNVHYFAFFKTNNLIDRRFTIMKK